MEVKIQNMTGDKDDYCQSGLAARAGEHWLGHCHLSRAGRGGNRFYGDGISENYENRMMLLSAWLSRLQRRGRAAIYCPRTMADF